MIDVCSPGSLGMMNCIFSCLGTCFGCFGGFVSCTLERTVFGWNGRGFSAALSLGWRLGMDSGYHPSPKAMWMAEGLRVELHPNFE
jgi:hypothetical protein